jgi:NADP+-dependent farnesol dehydrogenase
MPIIVTRRYKIDGHIFHINSLLGHLVPDFRILNVYCASKFAVGVEMLRQEFNREDNRIKITVNNVWHKNFFLTFLVY